MNRGPDQHGLHSQTFGQRATRKQESCGLQSFETVFLHRERCAGSISQLSLPLTVSFIFLPLLHFHLHHSSSTHFLFVLIHSPVPSTPQLLPLAMGNGMNKQPPPPMVLVPPLFDYPPLAARTRYVFSNLLSPIHMIRTFKFQCQGISRE